MPTDRSNRTYQRPLLLLIFAVATALRLWYASYELTEERFWDERYNFENVASILETGSLRPAKVYYPSPLVSWPQAGALAASDALFRWTGIEAFTIRSGESFSPTAYLICRLFSLVYGVASLWVLYLVGRRIFGEPTALLATLALSLLPWHIHVSGKFKPDAFVVLTVAIAFLWCLHAVRRPSVKSYALAGFGIALALSSKLTGGVVAVPLVLGSLIGGWGERFKRVGLVALAGVTSLVAFLLMNPYGRWYLGFLSGLQRDYAMRAEWVEMTRWEIPLRAVGYLLSDYVHGPVVGAIAIAGGALLAVRVLVRRDERLDRAYWSMLLVFPLAFIAAYTVATPYFKGNNFLPVVPFTCVLAGWAALGAWRHARAALPAGRVGASVATTLVTIALLVPAWLYVYRSLVPTGVDVARHLLLQEAKPLDGRFFHFEAGPLREPQWEGHSTLVRRYPGFLEVGELSSVAEPSLDLGDAELFPSERVDSDAAEFYRRRMQRAGEANARGIEPRLFRVRAPAATLLAHPWRHGARYEPHFRGRCKPGRNCFRFLLTEGSSPRAPISLAVTVPKAALGPGQIELGIDVCGRRLNAVRVGIQGRTRSFLSERFRPEGAELEVRLTALEPRLLRRDIGFEVFGWLPVASEES